MKSITILIVDDSFIIRKSFAQILNTLPDVRVVGECSDGVEVLPFVQFNKVDVVFMDICMKFMDGFEATKEVKRHNSDIKVIGFSSLDDYSSKETMKQYEFDGFLSKYDVSKSMLMNEIKRVMNLNRMI
ncbi:MAG: response regulator transcription factor [Flavobacteriales bacterium]